MKTKIALLLIVSLSLFQRCDTIDGSYIETPEIKDSSVTVTLIEFTGMLCGNCPAAHAEVEVLKATYGENLQIISAHASSFAEPNSEFPDDFRCAESTALLSQVGNEGLPKGCVNTLAAGSPETPTQWATLINNEIQKTAQATINVSTQLADEQIMVEIVGEFYASLNKNVMLCAYLIEDGVVAKQKEYTSSGLSFVVHDNYLHRYMLRASLNGNLGESVIENPVVGTTFAKSYVLNLKSSWDTSKLSVVVFLYENDSKNSIPLNVKYIK